MVKRLRKGDQNVGITIKDVAKRAGVSIAMQLLGD